VALDSNERNTGLKMPTASKLVAAVVFALVGWLAAQAYIPQLPESTRTGNFREIMAALGFVIGWWTLGPVTGKGYVDAISYGLRTSVFLFWGLLGFSIYFMVQRSTKMIYKDVGQAVLDVPIIMLQYAKLLGSVQVIEVLVVGGIIGGLASEVAARKWK